MGFHGLLIKFKELSETSVLRVSPGEAEPYIWRLPLMPREGCLVSVSAN